MSMKIGGRCPSGVIVTEVKVGGRARGVSQQQITHWWPDDDGLLVAQCIDGFEPGCLACRIQTEKDADAGRDEKGEAD